MPVSFLSDAERQRFNSFPADMSPADLIAFFTLSENDLRQVPKTTTPPNRLGFALRIPLLRFLGFHLPDLTTVPEVVIEYVGSQIGTAAARSNFTLNATRRGPFTSGRLRIIWAFGCQPKRICSRSANG